MNAKATDNLWLSKARGRVDQENYNVLKKRCLSTNLSSKDTNSKTNIWNSLSPRWELWKNRWTNICMSWCSSSKQTKSLKKYGKLHWTFKLNESWQIWRKWFTSVGSNVMICWGQSGRFGDHWHKFSFRDISQEATEGKIANVALDDNHCWCNSYFNDQRTRRCKVNNMDSSRSRFARNLSWFVIEELCRKPNRHKPMNFRNWKWWTFCKISQSQKQRKITKSFQVCQNKLFFNTWCQVETLLLPILHMHTPLATISENKTFIHTHISHNMSFANCINCHSWVLIYSSIAFLFQHPIHLKQHKSISLTKNSTTQWWTTKWQNPSSKQIFFSDLHPQKYSICVVLRQNKTRGTPDKNVESILDTIWMLTWTELSRRARSFLTIGLVQNRKRQWFVWLFEKFVENKCCWHVPLETAIYMFSGRPNCTKGTAEKNSTFLKNFFILMAKHNFSFSSSGSQIYTAWSRKPVNQDL